MKTFIQVISAIIAGLVMGPLLFTAILIRAIFALFSKPKTKTKTKKSNSLVLYEGI